MKKIINYIIGLVTFSLFLGSTTGYSQQINEEYQQVPQDSVRVVTDRKPDRLAMVRQMVAQGAYISAIGILEEIHKEEPNNPAVIDLMLTCYTELKAYDKGEALLKEQLKIHPDEFRMRYKLLELYLNSGADSLVDGTINDFLAQFPGNPDLYFAIVRMIFNSGNAERTMRLINQGRKEFNRDYLYGIEAASILERKGNYYDAVMEYYKIIRNDSTRAPEADRGIAELIRYRGAPPEVIRALQTILKERPDDLYALRVLREAYIKNSQYTEAFDISIKLDSLSQSTGMELYQYLRQCRERKLYEQVVKISEYIDRKYVDNPTISEYKFFYGEGLAGLGRFREALTNYQKIIDTYPKKRDQVEALMRMAKIFRYDLADYDSARVYFEEIISDYVVQPHANEAWIERGRLAIIAGRLDSAREELAVIQGSRLNGDLNELVDYTLGQIAFFEKRYGEANLAFRKLIEDYPRGFYVNDALINSLIILEASEASPEALDLYSGALYAEYRMQGDSVENKLGEILKLGDTPLVGLAGYKLARVFVASGDTLQALETIDNIEKNFGQNYFFPYCLKLRGEIYANKTEKRKDAAEIFKTILDKYRIYPFNGEVREMLQSLEGVLAPG
jgi:tetratricopeptide (TPR) repeat protein